MSSDERPSYLTDEMLKVIRSEEAARGRRLGYPLIRKITGLGTHRGRVAMDWVAENTAPPEPRGGLSEPTPVQRKKQELSYQEDGDRASISSLRPDIRSLDDALNHFDVDLDIWGVDTFTINKWDMGYVDKKTGGPDALPLYQVKVWLKRKAPKPVVDAILHLIKTRMERVDPVDRIYKHVDDPHLLVLSPVDHHFGKLAWGEETGQDYDVKIAAQLYVKAVQHTLTQVGPWKIDKIEIPLGHDFFHYDTDKGQTASGTQMDTDSRPAKVFITGCVAMEQAVREAAKVAPVTVRYVPGNHDYSWAYHACVYLWGVFRDDANVTVDISPMPEKVIEYGINFILETHGSMGQTQLKQLPTQMATTYPEIWGRTRCWEILIGHFHTRKEMQFIPVNEHSGVVLRVLPSLCGTDQWHFLNGYKGNKRAMISTLYSKKRGYAGQIISYADELMEDAHE